MYTQPLTQPVIIPLGELDDLDSFRGVSNDFLQRCIHPAVLSLFLDDVVAFPDILANPHPLVVERVLADKERILSHESGLMLFANPHPAIVDMMLERFPEPEWHWVWRMSANPNEKMLDRLLEMCLTIKLQRHQYFHFHDRFATFTYPPTVAYIYDAFNNDVDSLPECELSKELIRCDWRSVNHRSSVGGYRDPELIERFVREVLDPWYTKEVRKPNPQLVLPGHTLQNPSDVLVDWFLTRPLLLANENILKQLAGNPNDRMVQYIIENHSRFVREMAANPSPRMVEYLLSVIPKIERTRPPGCKYKRRRGRVIGEQLFVALLRRGDFLEPFDLIEVLAECPQVEFKIEEKEVGM